MSQYHTSQNTQNLKGKAVKRSAVIVEHNNTCQEQTEWTKISHTTEFQ